MSTNGNNVTTTTTDNNTTTDGHVYSPCDCYHPTSSSSSSAGLVNHTGCITSTAATTTTTTVPGDLHLNATSLSHTHEMNQHSLLTSGMQRTLKRSTHDEHNNRENSPCESPHSSSCSVHVPLSVVMLILLTYILIGGVIFSHWHPTWTFLDGCFHSFLTLSTISSSSLSPTNRLSSSSSSSSSGSSVLSSPSSSPSPSNQLYLTTVSPSSIKSSSSSSLMSSSTIDNLVSLSTDVDSKNNLSHSLLHHNSTGKQIAITVIYLLMGFALISMCFNLIYSDIRNYLLYINRSIDSLFNCSNTQSPKHKNTKNYSDIRRRKKYRQRSRDNDADCSIESVTGSRGALTSNQNISLHHHHQQQQHHHQQLQTSVPLHHSIHRVSSSRQPMTHSILSSADPNASNNSAAVTVCDEIINS